MDAMDHMTGERTKVKTGDRVRSDGDSEEADAGRVIAVYPDARSDGLPLLPGQCEVAWNSGVCTPAIMHDLWVERSLAD